LFFFFVFVFVFVVFFFFFLLLLCRRTENSENREAQKNRELRKQRASFWDERRGGDVFPQRPSPEAMSVIDLLTRVEALCQKYEKYDIDKQREQQQQINGGDAFLKLYTVFETELAAIAQVSLSLSLFPLL
jgi:hypothetical protein